jgi:methyl-accepting chemotaxis protein
VEGMLQETVNIMNDTLLAVSHFATNSTKNASDTAIIASQISKINDLSVANNTSMEEITMASKHLYNSADELTGQLQKFKTS